MEIQKNEKVTPKKSSTTPKKKAKRKVAKGEDRKTHEKRSMTVAERNRAVRQEDLRLKLQGIEYLRQIELIDSELTEIAQSIKTAPSHGIKEVEQIFNQINSTTKEVKQTKKKIKINFSPLDEEIKRGRARVDVLMQKSTLNFKRLNKLLPDIKAIELKESPGSQSLEDLPTDLLSAIALGQISEEEILKFTNGYVN